MARVLLVQSPSATSGVLNEMLEKLQHKVVAVQSLTQALRALAVGGIDTALIDVNDCSSAVTCLEGLSKSTHAAATPVIVATTRATADEVIETMRLGAVDHLSKPISQDELGSVLSRALARPKQSELDCADQPLTGQLLIGLSPAMRSVAKAVGIAATCDTTVLLQGETGTGKDTVARTIHRHSRHKNNTLTVVDCTAVPEDYESFQSLAPGGQGTVILDEIGDLNAQTQAILVRALKEAPPGLRIIATTQYDLIDMVRCKRFREDLYYRLNVLAINLPPLKDRGSDVVALAEAFLQQARPETKMRLSSSACKALLDYTWPGNVRELQNVIYHLSVAVRSPVIEDADLPSSIRLPNQTTKESDQQNGSESLDYHRAVSALEKQLLTRALKEAQGSRAEAARLLGINRQLLYAKLKTFGLMEE